MSQRRKTSIVRVTEHDMFARYRVEEYKALKLRGTRLLVKVGWEDSWIPVNDCRIDYKVLRRLPFLDEDDNLVRLDTDLKKQIRKRNAKYSEPSPFLRYKCFFCIKEGFTKKNVKAHLHRSCHQFAFWQEKMVEAYPDVADKYDRWSNALWETIWENNDFHRMELPYSRRVKDEEPSADSEDDSEGEAGKSESDSEEDSSTEEEEPEQQEKEYAGTKYARKQAKKTPRPKAPSRAPEPPRVRIGDEFPQALYLERAQREKRLPKRLRD